MFTFKKIGPAIVALFLLVSAAQAQSTDLTLRCQSPQFQTDFIYIGLNEARTNADVVSFSSSGIFEAGTALGVRVTEERFSFRISVNGRELVIDRSSLELASRSDIGTRRYTCIVQPDGSELLQAINRYQQEAIQQEIERNERLNEADNERKI